MPLDDSNDELRFVRHAIGMMDNPPNLRPDLEPGGEWRCGAISLTWGLRTVTEPPTIYHSSTQVLKTNYLPRELGERILIWKHRIHDTTELSFRDRIILTAILNLEF